MAFGAREDHTEPATPKRREEARKRGQIPRSRELVGALGLLAVVAVLRFLGPPLWENLARELQHYLQEVSRGELQIADIQLLVGGVWVRHLFLIAPVLGIAMLVGVAANFLQVGVLFTADPLLPRWSRLNRGTGISRLFSLQAFTELAKAVLKIAIVGAVAYSTVRAEVDALFSLGEQGIAPFAAGLAGMTTGLLWRSGLALRGCRSPVGN
jgi:flagellar biosynthetic protein FlhB